MGPKTTLTRYVFNERASTRRIVKFAWNKTTKETSRGKTDNPSKSCVPIQYNTSYFNVYNNYCDCLRRVLCTHILWYKLYNTVTLYLIFFHRYVIILILHRRPIHIQYRYLLVYITYKKKRSILYIYSRGRQKHGT